MSISGGSRKTRIETEFTIPEEKRTISGISGGSRKTRIETKLSNVKERKP